MLHIKIKFEKQCNYLKRVIEFSDGSKEELDWLVILAFFPQPIFTLGVLNAKIFRKNEMKK